MFALLAQREKIPFCSEFDFFAANRVNIGRFLVIVGTVQRSICYNNMYSHRDMDRTDMGNDNYIDWLTSSATALGILLAVLSSSVSRGRGQSMSAKAVRFTLRKRISLDS